uniref:Axin 2 n=1 Tax=Oryctolagus cuniculus TaxID=9986 RepID=G1T2M6_RABIT
MSSAVLVTCLPDPSSSFREDAPRPPVPGEEGETPPCQLGVGKGHVTKPMPVSSNARRNEDGLGEPEGRASPDSPLTRWTKSLHCLLGDQDGAYLFRTFLEREKCVDTLDFWFACNGFRQMNLKDTKTLRVAKAIYKRYIENNSIVSKQLRPATKTYIRDGIKKQQIDSIMFDQAQTEIQSVMEGNAYQVFLTSDIYLEYVRSGGENPAYVSHGGLGSLKVLCGYLPTLNEEEEWTCADFKCKLAPTVVGLSSKTLRATASVRSTETADSGYRSFKGNDPVNPYHVGSGYVFAPATSANDSEISSDALTDDSMSMTDSSVDGIPPYRTGSKKQLQREMHRSVKANGQVSLPHFPVSARGGCLLCPSRGVGDGLGSYRGGSRSSRRSGREMRRKEASRREGAGREMTERGGGGPPRVLQLAGDAIAGPLYIPHLIWRFARRGPRQPRSRSPDHHHHHHQPYHPLLPPGGKLPPAAAAPTCPLLGGKGFVSKQTTKHVHHHYIHHHAGPKTKEELEAEATQRVRCLCSEYYCYCKCKSHPKAPEPVPGEQFGGSRGSTLPKRSGKGTEPGLALPAREGGAPGGAGALQLPGEEGDRSQDVWQWMLESERQSKPKPHSAQSTKKASPMESARGSPGERVSRHHLWGSSGHPRTAPRAHPFTQDPAVPPLTPPNTLAQLEEACRRLAEVSKPPKQRCCVANQQRDRNHLAAGQAGATPFSNPSLAPEEHKRSKNLAGVHALQGSEVVTYFFCGESKFRTGAAEEQLSKKGNYRYYFKKASDEFACGAVFEEVWDDETVLPMYEGRILGKVERIE